MQKIVFIMLIILFSTFCSAECWKVGGLKGYSAKAADNYKISEDGLSGKTFMVKISDEVSAVIPNDLTCLKASPTSLVCISTEENRSVVEVWSVDPINGVAFFTKSVSGYSIFDGGNFFVGNILGVCK